MTPPLPRLLRLRRQALVVLAAMLPAAFCHAATVKTVKPEGGGDYRTIQEAIDAVPDHNSAPIVIEIYPGRYNTRLEIPKGKTFLTLRGMGDDRTDVWIGSRLKNDERAVVFVRPDDFRCENLTIEDTGGTTAAVQCALYADGQRQVFENCLIKGNHNTLAVRGNGQCYFHFCEIWGNTDFIFGSATAVFDHCDLVERRDSGGLVASPITPKEVEFGLVFLQCHLVRGPGVAARSTFLMRPWGPDGHAAFIGCILDDHMAPRAWLEWDGREATCRAEEYGSVTPDGKPIDLAPRSSWCRRLTAAEAAKYTVRNIFKGWDPHANLP